MQTDDVGVPEQVLELHVADPDLLQFWVAVDVVRHDVTAEAELERFRDERADPPRADHADGLAMQVPADQAFEGEIVLADAQPAAADLSIKGKAPTVNSATAYGE